MNGRMYDPVTGMMLSPDNYIPLPYSPAGYNRYGYANGNPLKFVDPDGNFIILVAAIAAAFAVGNTVAHAVRGDIHNFWDGLKYFGQGAITGTVIGVTAGIGLGVPVVSQIITAAAAVRAATTAVSVVSGLASGIFNGNWNRLANAAQISLGRFYLDENKSFFGGIIEGVSRHTWEGLQSTIGYGYTQIRNAVGNIDRVDYFGGATFATRENSRRSGGISLGNYINVSIFDQFLGNFDDRIISDPLFMHEYGHTFDSRKFGFLYLDIIGLPSFFSAARASQISGEPAGVSSHEFRWYEMSANKHAAKYFGRSQFGVDWLTPFRSGTYETYYPRRKR